MTDPLGRKRGILVLGGFFPRESVVFRVLLAWLLAGLLVPLAAQDEAQPERPRLLVLEGTVAGPDGSPGAGAVVVSSAGGQAVAGLDGSFRLALALASGADELRVTAVRTVGVRTEVASLAVDPTRAGGRLVLGVLTLSAAGTCAPDWLPTFGEYTDVNGPIAALAVFDDGHGPALYAGGSFNGSCARLEGTRWIVQGVLDGGVDALLVFDDGSGAALYACGAFENADGQPVRRVARWNGQKWSPLGRVIPGGTPVVTSMVVHDDGGAEGPSLYVSGAFMRLADGTRSKNVGRWSKHGWSAVGGLTGRSLNSLASYDDGLGAGAMLYGIESTGTGQRIVRWDGTSWSIVEEDITTGANGFLDELEVFEEPLRGTPGRPARSLFLAGSFSRVAGVAARNIARWDGRSWSAVGAGPGIDVRALAVVDDGSGRRLCAGGSLGRVRRWDGQRWEPLPATLGQGPILALAAFDDGRGPALYAGSSFDEDFGPESYASRWDGTRWSALGHWLNAFVSALAVFDDGLGGGPALYAGGGFSVAGGFTAERVARWDGARWSPLASGVSDPFGRAQVISLVVHDDGRGPALFAGGEFDRAGGRPARNVARWDGQGWTTLGAGLDAPVLALAVFDDGLGGGPDLYAGGLFTASGAGLGRVPAARIARWDGTGWSALGSGLDSNVHALAVHDDGRGPALHVGGRFTSAGGLPAQRIARWDGASWSAVGSGFDDWVLALCSFDDGLGGGPALFAGGSFDHAGGVPVVSLARWDGTRWDSPGGGTDFSVRALTVFDDGRGPALFAGGLFRSAGGVPANRIARWDGSSWTGLGSAGFGPLSVVSALAGVETLFGAPALIVGGDFRDAGGTRDSFIGRWQGCPAAPPAAPRPEDAPRRPRRR
jgi:trimeric autotransporter adhesin